MAPNKDAKLKELFEIAVDRANGPGIELCIEAGVPVDLQVTRHRTTAAMVMARYNCPETLQFLIDKGADLNAQNHIGRTAFMFQYGPIKPAILKIIRNSDFNTDIQDHEGMTMAMYAASNNDIESLKMLAQKHADFSLKNNKGYTAQDIAKSLSSPKFRSLISKAVENASRPSLEIPSADIS